jgi:hypothetical protein
MYIRFYGIFMTGDWHNGVYITIPGGGRAVNSYKGSNSGDDGVIM